MYRQLYYIFFLLIILGSCARVGMPTGGPKDEKSPVLISASPEFGTTHFKDSKIKIYFNEYIKFKDLNKQLVISPPMNYTPEISPVGTASKFIQIKLNDTLKENTTYTFNFGNAIMDNAEGNVLQQFKYVFSTGDFIDSLKITGKVKDAIAPKTDKQVSVLLYEVNEKFNDSTIYKHKPDYIGSTLDSTFFEINNIKEGTYTLIALKDKNANMMFNPDEDKIGFLDQYVELPKDSLPVEFTLSLEQPDFKIINTSEISKNHIVIGYKGEWKASITSVKDKFDKAIPYVAEKDLVKDSLHIWYKDIEADSLKITVSNQDQLQDYYVRLRTKQQDSLQIRNGNAQTLHFRDTLSFLSNIPIVKIREEKIRLTQQDSTEVSFKIHTSNKFRTLLDFEKKPSTSYRLILEPGALEDFMGQQNDSIKSAFTVKSKEDYGELVLKVTLNTSLPVLIELLDDKLNLVQVDFLTESKELSYQDLVPGKYSIRAVLDANNNQKWDPGRYLQKIQPEKIIYFDKTIDLRANWTVNEQFTMD